MGDPKAFLNIPRQEAGYRPIHERITDFSQVEQTRFVVFETPAR